MSLSVQVSNISPMLEKKHLSDLFQCCGEIKSLTWNDQGAQKICVITFGDPLHAQSATFLSGTPLGDRQLEVSPFNGEASAVTLPPVAPNLAPLPLAPLRPSTSVQITPRPNAMPEVTIAPQGVVFDPGVLARASLEHEELIARTIYVGNLSLSVTEEHIKHFFSSCGTILFVKMAGRQPPARFAFVEFASKTAAATALTLTGSILLDCSLKVGKATNPIIKPKTKTDPNKLDDIMRKVREAQNKIGSKVGRQVSRSRSRSRGRRRRRSRSRDRGRRSRSRDRGRRERRRSRSRSPLRRAPKKKADPHAGMFFDGYTWQPIAAQMAAAQMPM
jgi:hypothetical protein